MKLSTILSLFHGVEKVGEVHVGCLEPKNDTYLYLRNQTCVSKSCVTSLMQSLCRDCYLQSPRVYHKSEVCSLCIVHESPEQLGFCMDDNANHCGEFSECCCCLSKVGELATKLTCMNFTMVSRISFLLFGV